MEKKLYLVTRNDDWDYDEFDAYVVCATSKKQAKSFAGSLHGMNPDNCTSKLIGKADDKLEIGLVLTSYQAG